MLSLRKILEKKWSEYDKDNIFFMIFEDDDLETAIEMKEQNEDMIIDKLTIDNIDKAETYQKVEDSLLDHFREEIGIGLRGFIADNLVLKDEI